MNRHSEVEAKFRADKVSLELFHRFIAEACCTTKESVVSMEAYKAVDGRDTYYDLGGKKLRFRQGDFAGGELTFKQRKSEDSILDRVEVNVRLDKTASTLDTMELLRALGAKEEFEIRKTSYIYRLKCSADPGFARGEYEAVIALYDVFDSESVRQRFLEVEIEASSSISEFQGRNQLDLWVKKIQNGVLKRKVQGPLNQSLYELYKPNKDPNNT